MYELRVDYLPEENYRDVAKVNQLLSEMATDDRPVIVTLRTEKEGGRACLSNEEYRHLIRHYAAECVCPLLDVELYRFAEEEALSAGSDSINREALGQVVTAAHESDKAVILSHHDFEKTPSRAEITQRIALMRDLGADLPKVAYMPQKEEDVYTLLGSAGQAWEERGLPLIAISMGDLGKASRVCGSFFGSFVTFAVTAAASSAPGQIETGKLRKYIGEFYSKSLMTGNAGINPAADRKNGVQMDPIVSIQNLTYVYPALDETQAPRAALRDVSLDIERGSFVAIIGQNGSGKSTLAKCINALLLPTEGQVLVEGYLTSEEAHLWDIRQRAGMVFQNPDNQIVSSIVEDDVAFGPENLGVEPAEIRYRVDEALAAVGMSDFAESAPHLLSGGQKQRIAIAGAMAMKPDIIVFDEPTAMLDPRGRQELMRIIHKLHGEGITCILITHFMEEAAQADRLVIMDEGEVYMDGTPHQVFSQRDKLMALGLAVPLIVELSYRLKDEGIAIPDGIIEEEEFIRALCPLK